MSSSLFCATSFSLTTNSSNKISALFPFPKKKQNPHLISSNGLSLSISHLNTKLSLKHRVRRPSRIIRFCYNQAEQSSSSSLRIPVGVGAETVNGNSSVEGMGSRLTVEVGNPNRLAFIPAARLSLGDQAFFLLSFIACTTSIAFTSLVIAAIPTLCAMARAATSLSKLADTAREELPSTMAAIRLSGMEISDLTLELSDLSHEIADGVNRSAQAVQVAEAGIRQMGTIARQQTMSMIQERANLPIISLQPAVAGAAKKTSHAVGRATKNLIYFISRGEFGSKSEDGVDRLEI